MTVSVSIQPGLNRGSRNPHEATQAHMGELAATNSLVHRTSTDVGKRSHFLHAQQRRQVFQRRAARDAFQRGPSLPVVAGRRCLSALASIACCTASRINSLTDGEPRAAFRSAHASTAFSLMPTNSLRFIADLWR